MIKRVVTSNDEQRQRRRTWRWWKYAAKNEKIPTIIAGER
jgi:hypothetical protein